MGEDSSIEKLRDMSSSEEGGYVNECSSKVNCTIKDDEISNGILRKDILLALYHEFNTNRIDYNTIKWRNVQFFTYLNATFISVAVGLITFKNGNLDIYTKQVLSILPISVLFISLLGYLNLKRESKLLWEQEASMFRIEKILGVHNIIKLEDKCWLMDDPYYVPKRNRNILYNDYPLNGSNKKKDLDDWLEFRWKKHKFGPIMKWVFIVETAVAFILISVLFQT